MGSTLKFRVWVSDLSIPRPSSATSMAASEPLAWSRSIATVSAFTWTPRLICARSGAAVTVPVPVTDMPSCCPPAP